MAKRDDVRRFGAVCFGTCTFEVPFLSTEREADAAADAHLSTCPEGNRPRVSARLWSESAERARQIERAAARHLRTGKGRK